MTSLYKYLKISNSERLRKIIISNPTKKNALNITAYNELTDALQKSATDDTVAIVAITGDGDYYSSGNDISGFLKVSDPEKELKDAYDALKSLIQAFCTFPKVLISVVNGPCIGIAATTAVLCDIIYAIDTAYFYTPFTKLGLCAEGGASYTFPKILGKSKACEVLLLNRKLSASEAYQFSMVSEVFKKSDLDSVLWPKLIESSLLPINSLRTTKKLISSIEAKELEIACDRELESLFERFKTQEFLEAVMNFMTRKSKL